MSLFGNYSMSSEQEPPASADTGSIPCHFNPSRRTSVSAECFDPYDAETTAPNTSSSSNAYERPTGGEVVRQLRECLRRVCIFRDLGDQSLDVILGSLVCREYEVGTNILNQGDEDGHYFYIIESGSVDYIVDGKVEGHGTAGQAFGELALLYNAPRAATVRVSSTCVCWLLDRVTFKNIMRHRLSAKQQHSREVISRVSVFQGIPQECRYKVADSLQPVTYEKGEVVINEGDHGNDFFVVDEGEVEVTSKGQVLGVERRGDYFGELALINDEPRAATVRAKTDLKLERLGRYGFERLIGPDIVEELRKRAPPQI